MYVLVREYQPRFWRAQKLAVIAKAGESALTEYRVRLDPRDVHLLRERALAESREGRVVYWTELLRQAVACMARKESQKCS